MSRTFKLFLVFFVSLVVVGCSLLPGGDEIENIVPIPSSTNEVKDSQGENSSSTTGDANDLSQPEVVSNDEQDQPFVPENSGVRNLAAELLAADIVKLSWDVDSNALGYDVRMINPDTLFSYRIANLPAEVNQFIDYLALENRSVIYQVVTLTDSGESLTSSLQIQTNPRQPNPIAIQTKEEEDRSVSNLIGPEGGFLSLTDSEGNEYRLEIPANAISLEMEVTMTAVGEISNWPLDGNFLAGVHIAPDGWLLNEPAILTISLTDQSTDDLPLVGFGYNGGGEEFHLSQAFSQNYQQNTTSNNVYLVRAVNQQKGRVIRLPVMELKGSGVGQSSPQNTTELALNNPPTNPSNAADQKSAAATAAEDSELAPLLSPEDLALKIPYNIYNQIFAINDCFDFKKSVASYQQWESNSNSQQRSNWKQDLLENLGKKAVEIAKSAAKECVQAGEGSVPSSVPCAEKVIRDIQTGSTPFYQELQNAMKANSGLLGELLSAQKDLEKCPHSFKVNDAGQLGTQWLSSCIPSLDRPFQVKFKNPSGTFQYRLYPDGSFSGRLEGDGGQDLGGASMNLIYSGTYKVEVLGRDSNGKIQELEIITSMKSTLIICSDGNCITQEDDAKTSERIPILVNPTRCEIP